jgi:hypothetical protein
MRARRQLTALVVGILLIASVYLTSTANAGAQSGFGEITVRVTHLDGTDASYAVFYAPDVIGGTGLFSLYQDDGSPFPNFSNPTCNYSEQSNPAADCHITLPVGDYVGKVVGLPGLPDGSAHFSVIEDSTTDVRIVLEHGFVKVNVLNADGSDADYSSVFIPGTGGSEGLFALYYRNGEPYPRFSNPTCNYNEQFNPAAPCEIPLGPGDYALEIVRVSDGQAIRCAFSVGDNMVAQVGVSFGDSPCGPVLGDFQLIVSPLSGKTSLADSATYQVSIAPVDGFLSPVTLSVSGPATERKQLHTSFSQNPILPGQEALLTVNTQNNTPSGTRLFTLTATSEGVSHSQDMSLAVTKLVGLKNAVTVTRFNVENSYPCWTAGTLKCFSIQQNFRVTLKQELDGYTFWAQNGAVARKTISGDIEVMPIFQVFDKEGGIAKFANGTNACLPRGILGECLIEGSFTRAQLPLKLTFTSQVKGSDLVMTNELASFTFPLGKTGAFINTKDGILGRPELVLVGAGTPLGGILSPPDAKFKSGTSGFVKTSVKLAGKGWSSSASRNILDVGLAPKPETAETSRNLDWTVGTSTVNFKYKWNAKDQGFNFVPK